MTKTTCDKCGKGIERLEPPICGIQYGVNPQSPDGFRMLLPVDLTCAQVRFVDRDICHGCACEIGRSK